VFGQFFFNAWRHLIPSSNQTSSSSLLCLPPLAELSQACNDLRFSSTFRTCDFIISSAICSHESLQARFAVLVLTWQYFWLLEFLQTYRTFQVFGQFFLNAWRQLIPIWKKKMPQRDDSKYPLSGLFSPLLVKLWLHYITWRALYMSNFSINSHCVN